MQNQNPHCLIVDDSEFDRARIRRMMNKVLPNVPLVVARNLAEARERLAERVIGIIFLDNILPDGQGVNFVAELKENEDWNKVPVVIVSDFPTPFMYAKAEKANVCGVWSKNKFSGGVAEKVVREYAVGMAA